VKNNLRVFFLLIFVILFLNSVMPSQIRESGVIQGNVTDNEGAPLAGVTVTLESPSYIGGAHTRMTDSKGFYQFPSLTIGVYKITVELTGFNKMIREGIQVHAGLTLTADFKMGQSTLQNEIRVTATTPTVDVKSSQAAAVIMTDSLLTSIPSGKDFSMIMNMAPGLDYYTAYGSGYAVSNRYQLDGIDLTDPRWGGISSFTVDYNIIKEAAVQSLGLPAEFGHFTGTVMTAVTKSGSNRFSTLEEIVHNGRNWCNQNNKSIPVSELYDPSMATTKATTPNYLDLGGQVGGKIIQDKLWFFLSGEYTKSTAYPLGTTKHTVNSVPKFFGKLTYELNSSNRLNIEANYYDNEGRNVFAGVQFPGPVDMNNVMPGMYGALSWTSTISPKTFLDAKFGFNWERNSQIPAAGLDVSSHLDLSTYTFLDNWYMYTNDRTWTYDFNVQLSHYLSDFLGSHDLKLGVQWLHYKVLYDGGYPGNKWYFDFGATPLGYIEQMPTKYDEYPTLITGFAQDSWSVMKRLTLNLGLRYDHYFYNIPAPNRGGVYTNWALSPRLGLTYDLLGDRKNILKFHYGVYHETLQANMMANFETRFPDTSNYTWDGTQYVFSYSSSTYVAPVTSQSNISHPWTQEIIAGFERELFRDASLSISFYDRTIGKAFGMFNTAAQYAPTTITNPGPDNIVGTADDLGPMTVYYVTNPGVTQLGFLNPTAGNPSWLTTNLKWYARGLEFVFIKRFSHRWQMIASYNYVRSKCNAGGGGVIFFLQSPNDLVNNYGETSYPQPHQFKLQANYILPLGISLGAYGLLQSGGPFVPSFSTGLQDNNYYTFIGVPPGQLHSAWSKQIDLKLEKIFGLKNGMHVNVMLDIYNLTNEYGDSRDSYYGSSYRLLWSLSNPRTFRIGVRIIY